MNIKMGNLKTFTKLGEEKKMKELEEKLRKLGYENEDNCEENANTEKKTWHIYDTPRTINFSFLTKEAKELLLNYSDYFNGKIAVTTNKQELNNQ